MITTILNKSWYDQKTQQLKALTKELRSFDPVKRFHDEVTKQFEIEWQYFIWFGSSGMQIQKSGDVTTFKALSPMNFIINENQLIAEIIPTSSKTKAFTIGEYTYGG
jgi:hypothetical protein